MAITLNGTTGITTPDVDSTDLTATGNFTSRGIDDNATSTAMTLDTSGNLLVGKTTADTTTLGNTVYAGIVSATMSGDPAIFANRAQDGSIIEFQQSGTPVGSIASRAGLVTSMILDPRAGGGGLTGGGAALYPTDNAGSPNDGVLTLGDASNRFNNLYLSGGVVFGSTGGSVTSKTLDDYEEGTFTPYFSGSGATGVFGYSTQNGYYEKVGNICHAHGFLVCNSVTSNFSGVLRLSGLPFTSQNLTNNYSSVNIGYSTSWATAAPQTGHTEPNLNFVILKYYGTAGNTGDLTAGLAASDGIIFSITYRTA